MVISLSGKQVGRSANRTSAARKLAGLAEKHDCSVGDFEIEQRYCKHQLARLLILKAGGTNG